MGPITLEEAKAKLKLWMDADDALALGQAYTIDVGGSKRELTRTNAVHVQERIKYWSGMVSRLSAGSGAPRIRRVVPRDL